MSLTAPALRATNCALVDIANERHRQDQLKAEGRFTYTLNDYGMSDGERLACIVEEVGEVARAVLEDCHRDGGLLVNDVHSVNLRTELSQVAALCVAWMERLPRA